MTSEQTMLIGARPAARAAALLAVLLGLLSAGCGPTLTPRPPVIAPYGEPQLWAVAPPLNESGVSIVQPQRIADALARELQRVEGIEALPVNRVLAGMQQLGLEAVTDDRQARALMDLLEADALVVGTVTAYDPYPPVTLGLAVQLFGRSVRSQAREIDPVMISRTVQGEAAPAAMSLIEPLAQAAGVYDARDHQTLLWLDEYAESRHAPDSAYGQSVYLVSMDLFTQFVSHRLIRDMLDREQARLATMADSQGSR